jgi:hypothetical protein
MATRSTIAIKTPKGIRSIYCHYDGYPEHTGAILREKYITPSKINELLELGDISYLGEDVGVWKQDFNDPIPGITLAYGRDRGEAGVEARNHPSVGSWLEYRDTSGCEYGYLWNGAEWETFEIDGGF